MTKYITGLTGAIVDITGHQLYNNGASPLYRVNEISGQRRDTLTERLTERRDPETCRE